MQNTATLTRAAGLDLRQWLIIDAFTCLVTGSALVAASESLASFSGLPGTLLFYAGVVLFPCAVLMLLAARTPARPLVWLVILGNVAWSAASVAVALALTPTTPGLFGILAQAAAVALLGLMERRALR